MTLPSTIERERRQLEEFRRYRKTRNDAIVSLNLTSVAKTSEDKENKRIYFNTWLDELGRIYFYDITGFGKPQYKNSPDSITRGF